MNEMTNEDPAPDFSDEKWLDENVRAAIENLQEILYEAGCGVNGLVITVPTTPGLNEEFTTDYGRVSVEAKEVQ